MAEADSPKQVLVVTRDDAVIAEARFGFPSSLEVTIARDAKDAEKLLEGDFRPGAVVVDANTGNAGGFALARDMSHIVSLRGIPILILLDRDQDVWLAKQSGAAAVATKPISARSLATNVLSLLN